MWTNLDLKVPYCTPFWSFILCVDVLKNIYLRYKVPKTSQYIFSQELCWQQIGLSCLIDIHAKSLNQKSADMLDMFERKVLRRIFGPGMRSWKYCIRRHHYQHLLAHPVVWAPSKDGRGMTGTESIFGGQPFGTRPRGRPRNRWADAVMYEKYRAHFRVASMEEDGCRGQGPLCP